MVATVGSMAVTGKFSAGAILSGVSSVIGKLKQTGFESKNLKVEMDRMTGSMKGMAVAAGALLAMLVRAIMTSPILAGSLAKLRIAFMLFGNTIAKHVKPIIEWVIKGVKWLHEKFKALPEPVQSAIVKFIIISGVILTLVSTLALLVAALGLVKTGMIALGAPKVLTAIGGSSAALLSLAAVVGIISGLFVVIKLQEAGVIDFFVNLGESFRVASGDAAVLRDILTIIGGICYGLLGASIYDVLEGDMGFSGTLAAWEKMQEAKHRLKTGEGYDVETTTTVGLPAGAGSGQNIGTQTNTTIVDLHGASFEVAGGPDGLQDLLNQIAEMEAQQLQLKAV